MYIWLDITLLYKAAAKREEEAEGVLREFSPVVESVEGGMFDSKKTLPSPENAPAVSGLVGSWRGGTVQ